MELESDWWATFYGSPEFIPVTGLDDPRLTERQVRFLNTILRRHSVHSILDVCCGWGRLTLPLAQLGFDVTGVDLSETYLNKAKEIANSLNAKVIIRRLDIRRLDYEGIFDAVISMSTSVGFFVSEEENQRCLALIAQAIRPSGLLILDATHPAACRRAVVRSPSFARPGQEFFYDEDRQRMEMVVALDVDGQTRKDGFSFRVYGRDELTRMLEATSIVPEEWFGTYEFEAYGEESPRMICIGRSDK